MFLLLHWFCLFVTSGDPKSANADRKMQTFVYWFCPSVSNILMLGICLPKTRQSYTIGIRLPWTLDNEENWVKTHRMAGRLWVIGGLLILLDVFFHLSHEILTMVTLCVLIVLPVIYSYYLSLNVKK
ncbi:SdpI family protein [Streptococcus ratti]|uniref:Hemolysis inducing protein n=2 Tax=Streptococcus ratti TaxID=1341 RepID=A0ABN0GTB6_STRRT|nr:SdpI family protein [Streptococcus ratti]EJN93634.1 hemolysis inducing protein [Streptococcus ratti FA-1 = DSM 20564]QEY07501.1 SdpI family protein [Streptococcus ratti]VEI59950.1 hemolysis inducing protein [Streptococcus mutans]